MGRSTQIGQLTRLKSCDREDAKVGVEARNPFMDRRIVELMFAFPHRQRQRGKVGKIILREAMHGLLPERVRSRLDKADFMHFFVDALRLVGQDFDDHHH